MVIEYRLSGSVSWTQYPVSISDTLATVQLQTGGTYDVRVTVRNQGGVSDTTRPRTVVVAGMYLTASVLYLHVLHICYAYGCPLCQKECD